MPKHDFLTPKAIANRIKAKGLQKLKFYCEMCKKQCRDENGFKCHTMSEAHQRQLLIFADDPNKFMNAFNDEFLDGYVDLLKRQYGGRRVHANQVYQDYIKDRDHVHMNSTRWHTLTGFVNWLGKKGICKVDETEEGWFVQYIDRDPEKLRREKLRVKMDEIDRKEAREAAERHQQLLEVARAREERPRPAPTELQRDDEDEEARVTFNLGKGATGPAVAASGVASNGTNVLAAAAAMAKGRVEERPRVAPKRKSALDEIMEENERSKRRQQQQLEQQQRQHQPASKKARSDHWLTIGIVVKLVSKKLPSAIYKRKAVVEKLENRYTAIVRVLPADKSEEKGPPTKLKVDQDHVETVIPAVGRRVRVVNGMHRGETGVLLGLNEKSFSCSVELELRNGAGDRVRKTVEFPYEDVSKLLE